jgi:hypothetical protein
MVAGHREAELGHGSAAVGEQAGTELRIDPRLGDHPRAVLRQPLLLGQVLELGDDVVRGQAALVQDRFDRGKALLDRRNVR